MPHQKYIKCECGKRVKAEDAYDAFYYTVTLEQDIKEYLDAICEDEVKLEKFKHMFKACYRCWLRLHANILYFKCEQCGFPNYIGMSELFYIYGAFDGKKYKRDKFRVQSGKRRLYCTKCGFKCDGSNILS